MQQDDIKLDENGVPLLETPVDPQQFVDGTATAEETGIDFSDQEQIDQLLQAAPVQLMIEDLADDLQKSVTLKIESFLKEEITRLVHEAAERSAPKIAEDIHTHLELAMPELLAEIAKRCKR